MGDRRPQSPNFFFLFFNQTRPSISTRWRKSRWQRDLTRSALRISRARKRYTFPCLCESSEPSICFFVPGTKPFSLYLDRCYPKSRRVDSRRAKRRSHPDDLLLRTSLSSQSVCRSRCLKRQLGHICCLPPRSRDALHTPWPSASQVHPDSICTGPCHHAP